MDRQPYLLAFLGIFCCALFGAGGAAWAAPTAQASLSDAVARVGEAVELQVVVSGARGARVLREPEVEGLSIQASGQQTSINIVNMKVEARVILSYRVTPLRAGEFEIPSIELESGGQKIRTEPLRFTASDSRPPASGGGSAAGSDPAGGGFSKEGEELMFAEVVPLKQKGFVGEAIPVEINVFVDARIRWEVQRLPEISGDGFTLSKLAQKNPKVVRRGGREYDQFTLVAILSPLKPGELSVGQVEIPIVAEIPQRRQARPSRRQIPGFPDMRTDPFFDDFFGSISVPQQVNVRAPGVTLDIAPLPEEGRPADFSGAVGRFKLASSASPSRVKPGDPVTVVLSVEGEGNFDLVKAPVPAPDTKWRAYPPQEKFEDRDAAGYRGVKQFDLAMIPEPGAGPLPPFTFSYFDPIDEAYRTVSSGEFAVAVEGGGSPPVAAATPDPAAGPRGGGEDAVTPTPAPAPEDILFIRTDGLGRGEMAEPDVSGRAFWLWQIAPALAALGFLGRRMLRARAARVDPVAEGWKAEQERLAASLRGGGGDRGRFVEEASRWLRLEVARREGRNPESVTRAEAEALPGLDERRRAVVAQLFSELEERRFSGGGGGGGSVAEAERAAVLELIGGLRR